MASDLVPEVNNIFSSLPRVVENSTRTREPPSERNQRPYGNIMTDPRVFRGRVNAQHIIPIPPQPDLARKRSLEQQRLMTPESVQGKEHTEVQTNLYLEEQNEVIVAADAECQTDEFLDRPASPFFIPAKSGKDTETQIEEGELFDFDVDVQPILDVLVGKVLEQSLLEVMEEEELACLKAQQRAFLELRNNELAEVQRLQEQERRSKEKKERRIAQEREVAEKIGARVYSQQLLAGLQPAVFSSLRNHGYFYDPVERDIEMNFLPWLMAEVHSNLEKRNTAREVLDTLIYEITEQRLKDFGYLETIKLL